MKSKSTFLSNLHYFYAQTDGTYAIPNSAEGDLLKTAKREIEALENENAELKAYADKLVDGLPCLPKDIEVLREANLTFANENVDLKSENESLRGALEQIAYDPDFGGPWLIIKWREIARYAVNWPNKEKNEKST